MIDVTSVTAKAAETVSAKKDDMGRQEFLKLFLSQLQAQDPMNPMESADFTAQLAQFSSLEQMVNANESLAGLLKSQQSQTGLLASSLLGKNVVAEGNAFSIRQDRLGADLTYVLDAEATDIRVGVVDANGQTVASLLGPPTEAGSQTVWWDGTDRNGNAVPPGDYTFNVRAYGGDGQEVNAQTRSSGRVSRVQFENGEPLLYVNNRLMPMSAILQIEDSL